MTDWISVKDRLPRHEVDVLVLRESWRTMEVRRLVSVEGYCDGEHIRSDSWYPGGSSVGAMTHWMPLPEPPK